MPPGPMPEKNCKVQLVLTVLTNGGEHTERMLARGDTYASAFDKAVKALSDVMRAPLAAHDDRIQGSQ